MSTPLHLLVSSAGRRVELMRCFRQDAARLGVPLKVVAVDACPQWSAACQEADAFYRVPPCTEPEFTDRLLEVVKREQIQMILPTIDTELIVYAEHRERFASEGIHVEISDPAFVRMTRDKLETMRFLASRSIPVPETLPYPEFLENPDSLGFPVLLKPRGGSSSSGIFRIRHSQELKALPALENYLAQACWEGAEYTVNQFFDQQGRLIAAVPHRRIEVRQGEVSKARTELQPELLQAARQIASAAKGIRGPICFQAMCREDGQFCLFEINARIGGGYPVAHAAGARFTEWMLKEWLQHSLQPCDTWEPGWCMLRYDASFTVRDHEESTEP